MLDIYGLIQRVLRVRLEGSQSLPGYDFEAASFSSHFVYIFLSC